MDKKTELVLINNNDLLDRLYLFRIYLKIKALFSPENTKNDLKKLYKEINYLIKTQKKDRDNLFENLEYIELMDKQGMKLYSEYLNDKLNSYLSGLRLSLAVNKLYLKNNLYKTTRLKKYKPNIEVSFDDVLTNRQTITKQQLILEKRRKGLKTWQ